MIRSGYKLIPVHPDGKSGESGRRQAGWFYLLLKLGHVRMRVPIPSQGPVPVPVPGMLELFQLAVRTPPAWRTPEQPRSSSHPDAVVIPDNRVSGVEDTFGGEPSRRSSSRGGSECARGASSRMAKSDECRSQSRVGAGEGSVLACSGQFLPYRIGESLEIRWAVTDEY